MNWVFYRTIPAALNWLALAAALILVIKIFMLNPIPEPVNGLSSLGMVFEGLLASVLASYIFYLLVVHAKEYRDRKLIYPHVTKWARALVSDCTSQLEEIGKAGGDDTLDLASLNLQRLEEVMRKADMESKAPKMIGNKLVNWYQYFQCHRYFSKQRISGLLSQLPYLDSSLVPLLMEINSCTHFAIIDTIDGAQLKATSLGTFANTFFDYCHACRNLELYLNEHVWHAAIAKE